MNDKKKEMLLALLAKRQGPSVEVEINEDEKSEEEREANSDLAPEGVEMSTESEDMTEEMPMADGEEISPEMMAEMEAAMFGAMKPEQLGKSPKGLRERALFEMMQKQKG